MDVKVVDAEAMVVPDTREFEGVVIMRLVLVGNHNYFSNFGMMVQMGGKLFYMDLYTTHEGIVKIRDQGDVYFFIIHFRIGFITCDMDGLLILL